MLIYLLAVVASLSHIHLVEIYFSTLGNNMNSDVILFQLKDCQ